MMAVPTAKVDRFSFPRRSSNSSCSSTKRNPSRNFSDVQSDIVVSVDGVNFSLHKFPLLSRSGRIRLLASELNESDAVANPVIEFSNFPGGSDTFELAAKFCYGLNFEITTANVAHLRCAAEYLEMTDDYGDENLINRTEAFINEVVLDSLEKSIEVLHNCEDILPVAEEVKLINRCIDAVASKACREQAVANLSRLECDGSGRSHSLNENGASQMPANCKAVVEWWADDLADLRIDLFQRVLAAMKSRGLRNENLGGALMTYAQKALKPLNVIKQAPDTGGRSAMNSSIKARYFSQSMEGVMGSKAMEHEQRILLESIVSLLPTERNMVPTNFLLSLLRAAIVIDTTVACRLDLERRIGAQLESATADDLLVPAYNVAVQGQLMGINGGTAGNDMVLFDVDIVQRVLAAYLQQQGEAGGLSGGDNLSSSTGGNNINNLNHSSTNNHVQYESDGLMVGGSPAASDAAHQQQQHHQQSHSSSSSRGIMRVAKLIDMYLAQIATDPYLTVSKFVSVAELLPDYARVLDDGLYRAIDIFLKAHPTVSEAERRKVCKLLDCQRLSQEACTHAAQNERLPVQLVVQVLYFEQLRMRHAMTGGQLPVDAPTATCPDAGPFHPSAGRPPRRMSMGSQSPQAAHPAATGLRRDNRELKLEVARLRLRVNDLENENAALKVELAGRPAAAAPPGASSSGHHHPGFLGFVSRRFGKMGLFGSTASRSPKNAGKRTPASKPLSRRRRHSIS